jgi:hypothetical protein
MELEQAFVLPSVLRTKTTAGEHQHQRIARLQGMGYLGEVPAHQS